jgi:hypothetical protein
VSSGKVKFLKYNTGITLISMMIGMMLGSMAVATAITLYKVILSQAAQSKVTTRQNTESVFALSTISSLLMKAGFGVRDAAGPSGSVDIDLVLLSDATLRENTSGLLVGDLRTLSVTAPDIPSTGNALVWSWVPVADRNVAMCTGLLASNGALLRLLPAPCASASAAWAVTSWVTQVIVKPRGLPNGELDTDLGFAFSVIYKNEPCVPFASQLGHRDNGGLTIQITDFTVASMNSNSSNGQRGDSLSKRICMPNIKR